MRLSTAFKLKLTQTILTILSATLLSTVASHASAASLAVNISQIESIQGHLKVAIYQGKENYQQGQSVNAQKVAVTDQSQIVIFDDLAEGDYAVKLYHDENDNDKLDSNFIGIPKEGYGFSNNGGRFGAPDYEDAKIIIDKDKVIEITLT